MFKIQCGGPPENYKDFTRQVKQAWFDRLDVPTETWNLSAHERTYVVYLKEFVYDGGEPVEPIGLLLIANLYNIDTKEMAITSTLNIYRTGEYELYEPVIVVEQMPGIWIEWIREVMP